MAESGQESVKWKRKRLLAERAALARAAKQPKPGNTSGDDPGQARRQPTSPDNTTGDDPGQARSQPTQQREAGESSDGHYESESENE